MDNNKSNPRKSITNILFIGLFLVLFFVPSARAFLMQGLMSIGLFSPNVEEVPKQAQNPIMGDIHFKNKNDQLTSLSDLKGKVVFINFWATWCPPCLAEMPSINRLQQKFKGEKDIVFMMISGEDDFKKSLDFLDKKGYALPQYALASNFPPELYNGSIPTTLVLDKKGQLAYHHVGAANYGSEKFIALLAKLKNTKN